MRSIIYVLSVALIGAVMATTTIGIIQSAQPWSRCIDRAGYVYVVDSKACVPFGALIPATEVGR